MAGTPTSAGTTRIAHWKDDRQAAFLLYFDDSAPTHVRYVVPALKRCGIVGSFYVNPANEPWQSHRDAWEREIPGIGMELCNHTMTHRGATSEEQLEEEISRCQEALRSIAPTPWPRLGSFGRPGVKPENWTVTDEQLAAALKRHNLVPRPRNLGGSAGAILNTADHLIPFVDRAIAERTVGHVLFHGVGGDWLTFPLEEFHRFGEYLVSKNDHLWMPGHMPVHKYEQQRNNTTIAEIRDEQGIQVSLTTSLDTSLYDGPLTLITSIPTGWRDAEVKQGGATLRATVSDGEVRYDVYPGQGNVSITAK